MEVKLKKVSKVKDDKKFSYFTAEHKSSLDKCLETEKLISKKTAIRLIETRIYIFYGFDKRINCYRFIINNWLNDLGLPIWLHVYKRR